MTTEHDAPLPPIPAPITTADTNVLQPSDLRDAKDWDDLIPPELKAVVLEKEKQGALPASTEKKEDTPPVEKKDDAPPSLPMKAGELDTSPEAIEKLLAGDPDAVEKKQTDSDEDPPTPPPWHEDEEYKKLLTRATAANIKQDELDKIIEAAADKKVLDKAAYIEGLQTKTAELEKIKDMSQSEIARLKRIERAQFFDEQDEIKEKYIKPMTANIREFQRILNLEGHPEHLTKVLNAKSKVELETIINESLPTLSDENLVKLKTTWTNYKESEFGYNKDKNAAQEDGRKAMSTSLTPEQTQEILRRGIAEFIKASPKYSYLDKAIAEGIEKHPDAQEVIQMAKKNFVNMKEALANPSDHVHNPEWMHMLSQFLLDAAHNRHIESKYEVLQRSFAEKEELLTKVTAAYRELVKSAKGITSTKGGTAVAHVNGASGKDNPERALAEFQKVLDTGILDI